MTSVQSTSSTSSTPKKTKWLRGPDWIPEEETWLSELCKSNREILDGDFKGASNSRSGPDLTNAKKANMWMQICDAVNSIAGRKRTVEQMKRKWRQICSNGIQLPIAV